MNTELDLYRFKLLIVIDNVVRQLEIVKTKQPSKNSINSEINNLRNHHNVSNSGLHPNCICIPSTR